MREVARGDKNSWAQLFACSFMVGHDALLSLNTHEPRLQTRRRICIRVFHVLELGYTSQC